MALLSRLIARLRSSKETRILLKGSAVTFGTKVIGSFGTLAFSILLARYLGADAAGVYYTAASAAFLIGMIAQFGMPGLVMRETAASFAGGSKGYRVTLQRIQRVLMAGLLAGMVALVALSWAVASLYGRAELRPLLMIWAFSNLAMAALAIAGQILRGAQSFHKSGFILFASVSLFNLAFLSAMAFGLADLFGLKPLMAAMFAQIAAAVVAAALAIWWAKTTLAGMPRTMWNGVSMLNYRRIVGTGFSLLLNMLSTSTMRWADTLILAAFVLSSEVAVYNSAARVGAFVLFVAALMGTVAGPRMTSAFRNGRRGELGRTFAIATLAGTAIVLPIAIMAGFFAKSIMGIFGPDFTAGAGVLQILVIGAIISALVGPYGELLIAAGKEVHVRNSAVAACIIGILMLFILTPIFGVCGTAAAMTISISTRNLWNLIAGWHVLGIEPAWLRLLGRRQIST
ncbi:MAG TPA: hypothetical protein ENI99_12695 [Sedimenticola sp.]|nr:hypothetical protein [Sedimenticola sp.]